MASVYLRDNSPFWMARFRTPKGKWTAKTTKQTSRTKALEVAHLWESGGKLLLLENPQGAQFERVLRGLHEQLTGKRMEPNPAGQTLLNWVKAKSAQKAVKTGERYGKVISDFVKYLGDGATLDLRTVTKATVQSFLNRESENGKSATTVILNAKILRAAFNSAKNDNYIEHSPTGNLVLPNAAQNDRQPFTQGEVNALLKAAKKTEWATAIMLGRHLGMRLGDATTLKWDSVDFTKRLIEYMPQKTSRKGKGKVLKVPMTAELEKYLDRLASRESAQGSTYLCPKLHKRQIGGRAGLSAEFMALMEKAGVDCGRIEGTGGVGRAFSAKSFHSLRHMMASDLANSGAPEKVARDILGHASAAMTDRYTHIHVGTARRALEKSQQPQKSR